MDSDRDAGCWGCRNYDKDNTKCTRYFGAIAAWRAKQGYNQLYTIFGAEQCPGWDSRPPHMDTPKHAPDDEADYTAQSVPEMMNVLRKLVIGLREDIAEVRAAVGVKRAA